MSTTPPGPPPADPRFDALFRSSRRPLLGLVSRVVDHAEAEDVVQESFLKLSADPVLARPEPEITAWLRRVALNLAFNRARDVGRWRQRTERALTDETLPQPLDPETEACRSDERHRVRGLLDSLPVKQRDCLLLRHAGYSYAEIAATLEIPASSVGTTLARGEKAFRAIYEAHPHRKDEAR